MRTTSILLLATITLLATSCGFKTNEELAIEKMVADFVHSVQINDENRAHEILLDLTAFRTLNPDAGARTDAAAFTDAVLSDLIVNYRSMVSMYGGKQIEFKSLTLGGPWYQYKGFSAFKDNIIIITVDGEDVEFIIRGIVKIGENWRIVDLSDNGLF